MKFGTDVIVAYTFPFFATLILIEYLLARHVFKLKESLAGIGVAIGASVIAVFSKTFALAVFIFFFEVFREIRLEILGYESLGWAWYIWLLAIVGDDFNFYWHHRLSHTIRLLWAAHVPHHSSKSFNLIVAIRNGWFPTLYKPIFWLWMPILGFDPAMIAFCLIFNGTYQFCLHTQLVPSLGWVAILFNTPQVHQVHHASNIAYLDKNHGGVFIIWDKLFGTYKTLEPHNPPIFGIINDPHSYNPFVLNTHEFANIWQDVKKVSSLKDKLKYIFYPPGWSHDQSSKTVKEMQTEVDFR